MTETQRSSTVSSVSAEGSFPKRPKTASRQPGVWRKRGQAIALGVAFPVVGLAVWQLLTVAGVLNATFFPAPVSIVQKMIDDLTQQGSLALLGKDLGVTVGALAVSFGLGTLVGLIVGVMMGVSWLARVTLSPTLYVVYAIPMIALYPLALILFGLGEWSTIATAALGTFFVVCISTVGGVSSRNPIYDDVARVFYVPRWVKYVRVVIPGALPTILSGLKLGLAQALIIVLSIEFIGSTTGMGAYLWNAWQALEVGQMFVGLFVVLVLAGVIVVAGNLVERAATPWVRR